MMPNTNGMDNLGTLKYHTSDAAINTLKKIGSVAMILALMGGVFS